MTTEQPTLPLTTAEGEPLALPPTHAWREHTAERWKERDPESYQFAIYLVRELGLTNKSEIERLVREHREARNLPGISRNSIIALFHDQQEFRPGEIDEIIRRRSALLSADALDKIEELLYKAKAAKDLGAAAMALTAVYNVKQLAHGGATRISGSTEDGKKAKTFDDFMKLAREKMKEAPLPLHEPSVEVEVLPVKVGETEAGRSARAPLEDKTL
jgi:hypothetical protein